MHHGLLMMDMLTHFSVFLVGYTLFSAASLAFAYVFFLPHLKKNIYSKLACVTLLLGLASLQYCHYLSLTSSFDALANQYYLTCLLLVPASFYYFSRFVLFVDSTLELKLVIHLIPILVSFFLPDKIVPPVAFMIGSAYCLWFVHLVLKLRIQQGGYVLERFFFGSFAIIVILALLLVLMLPYIGNTIFYLFYGGSIGFIMFLVCTVVIIFPEMLNDIQTATQVTYVKSTLCDINVDAKKMQLELLIQQDNIYQNEKLSLSYMANLLDLSAHQLSELINTKYGFSFSRFVRRHRIEQAKRLLLAEPNTSVLAISIMTGFQSQSNFYTAFKNETKESPGQYRSSRLATS